MSDFNNASSLYDQQFSFTSVGKAQRDQVWKAIDELDLTNHQSVLEVNCGTGEDANIWTQQNKTVLATDLSSGMIQQAKQKYNTIDFQVLNSLHIDSLSENYDIIFSNFGGLNCLSPEELKTFIQKAYNQLNENGKLIVVVMGKKTIWDKTFQLLKGNWKTIHRRNTNHPISVNVDNTSVNTWYYEPKSFLNHSGFTIDFVKPIGLFVPPSYLSKFFDKKKLFLHSLKQLDKAFNFSVFANFADHYAICLTKKASHKA